MTSPKRACDWLKVLRGFVRGREEEVYRISRNGAERYLSTFTSSEMRSLLDLEEVLFPTMKKKIVDDVMDRWCDNIFLKVQEDYIPWEISEYVNSIMPKPMAICRSMSVCDIKRRVINYYTRTTLWKLFARLNDNTRPRKTFNQSHARFGDVTAHWEVKRAHQIIGREDADFP